MKTLFALLICLLSTPAFSAVVEGQDRNGGDEIGAAARADLSEAISRFKKMPISRSIDFQKLEQVFESTKIVVVDVPLATSIGGKTQTGAALNVRSDNLIFLNRERILNIENSHARGGILLHELLCLAGMESTGYYPFSGEYLRSNSVSLVEFANFSTEPSPPRPSTAPKYSLRCQVYSRDFEIPESKTMIDAKVGGFETAFLGGYIVQLGLTDNGLQGQLIVSHQDAGPLQKTIWQSLSQFKGIDLAGGHGFTGLMYIGGDTEWPSKFDDLPELQMFCWVK